MKAFIAAVVALAVISFGMWYALNNVDYSATEMTSKSNVRLGD